MTVPWRNAGEADQEVAAMFKQRVSKTLLMRNPDEVFVTTLRGLLKLHQHAQTPFEVQSVRDIVRMYVEAFDGIFDLKKMDEELWDACVACVVGH